MVQKLELDTRSPLFYSVEDLFARSGLNSLEPEDMEQSPDSGLQVASSL